jgi:chaperone required for assembly of F1-ATPase
MKEKRTPVYDLVHEEDLYGITRNARALMTPKGHPYAFVREDLARAVLKEWRAQGERINASTMPLTQLAATTLDIVAQDRGKVVDGLLAFTRSELLCHRAGSPQGLAEKQNEIWQPALDWCAGRYGVSFALTEGVMPSPQSDETVAALRTEINSFDDFRLTGLRQAADTSGSLVLGLALAEGHMGAHEVFEVSELDVLHQSITWGDDPVTQGRHKSVLFDLEACEIWFSLLRV